MAHLRRLGTTPRTFTLGQQDSLGRNPGNSILVEDQLASKQHCVIERRGETYRVRDLGSVNGTLVNGERITAEHVLRHGDVLMLGNTKLRFFLVEPTTGRRVEPSAALLDAVRVGTAFAFLPAAVFEAPEHGWIAALLGESRPRVVSLLGDGEVALPGALVKARKPPRLRLSIVTSDKAIYREGRDTVRLLVVSPFAARSYGDVLVHQGGREWGKRRVRFDANGIATLSLSSLPVGVYEVRPADAGDADPACSFSVVEYRLAPLVASLDERRVEGKKLVARLRLETYGVPVNGPVDLELSDDGRRVSRQRVEAHDGIARVSFELEGEGPFAIQAQLVGHPSRTATVPIVGSRATERELTPFSQLGVEIEGSLLPQEGSREVRGIHLVDGAVRTSPFRVERIDGRTIKLKVMDTVAAATVVVIDASVPAALPDAVDARTAQHPALEDAGYRDGEAAFNAGRFGEAAAIFDRARGELPRPHPAYAYYVACCHARLGDRTEALAWLRTSLRDGWHDLGHMRRDEDLALLRGDPAFEAMGRGGLRVIEHERLDAGAEITLPVPSPAAAVAIGAFVGDRPWEGWLVSLAPDAAAPEVDVAPTAQPGGEIVVRVSKSQGSGSVYLVVKDARLLVTDTPTSRLAGQIKSFAQDVGRSLSTGDATTPLAEIAPAAAAALVLCPQCGHANTLAEIFCGSCGFRLAARPPAPTGFGMPMQGGIVPAPAAAPAGRPGAASRRLSDDDGGLPFSPPMGAPPPPAPAGFGPPPQQAYAPAPTLLPQPPDVAAAEPVATAPARAPSAPTPQAAEPDVLFAGVVALVDGVASVSIPIPDVVGDYLVEAFVLAGLDWTRVERRVRAAKTPYVALETPAFVHPQDVAVGRAQVQTKSGRARVVVTRDGVELPLFVAGRPVEPGTDVPSGELTFYATPGAYRADVVDPADGAADRQERTVDAPGRMRRIARSLVLLAPGERVSLAPDVRSLRVLPGLDRPFRALVHATSDYGHACCEQTAAKLLAAGGMLTFAQDDDTRTRAEAIVVAGVRRLGSMWLRGRGFKMYPESAPQPAPHWGPLAARYLWSVGLLEKRAGITASVEQALEMARDACAAYNIAWPPREAASCEDAYAILRYGGGSQARAAAARVEELVKRADVGATGLLPPASAPGAVGGRVESAYAAASLLRARVDLGRALPLANAVTRSIGDEGRLYSTVDSVAAIALMTELVGAGIIGAGRLRLDGREVSASDAGHAPGVEEVVALEGVVAVEVARVIEERWDTLASSVPLRVALERDGRPTRKVTVGDALDLRIQLEQGYRAGDILWVCLPDALSRLSGGAQVKRFSVDFQEKNELVVPLAATSTTLDGRGGIGAQRFAVCVRNMFEEERAGNPGFLEVSVVPPN